MVTEMLSFPSPPQVFVRFLARHSEGNPFFVAEYLRTAVSEGILHRDESGCWQLLTQDEESETEIMYDTLPLPGSIKELVGRRLAGMSDKGRFLIEIVAVLGQEVDPKIVAMISGKGESEWFEELQELIGLHALEEVKASHLRFVHNKIREVTYERIPPERLQKLHGSAAVAIDKIYKDQREDHLAELGRHWDRAGEFDQARECYLAAARKSKVQYAHREAERLYRAFFQLQAEPTADSIEARNELAIGVFGLQGRMEELKTELELAKHEARKIGDPRAEANSLRGLGCFYLETGHMDQARELLERALKIHRQLNDKVGEGVVLLNLAVLKSNQGELHQAKELYEQSLSLLRKDGHPIHQAMVLGNLAVMYHNMGDLDNGRELFEQALVICRKLGDRWREATVQTNLALLHRDQGRLDEAVKLLEQALLTHRQMGNRRLEGVVLSNLAGLENDQGGLEKARELYEQALTLYRKLGNRQLEGTVLGNLSSLEWHCTGNINEARRFSKEAETILTDVGDKFELVSVLCKRGHMELGVNENSREFLDRARKLAGETAVKPESHLFALIARLQQAHELFEAQEFNRLFRGELIEDIPEKIRRWLVEKDQLPEDRAMLNKIVPEPEGLSG